jgi:hypothetical protein
MGQVITANRLRDGAVVFMGPDSTWVDRINAAKVFASSEDAATGLAASKKDEDENLVLDIYAIDVTEKNGAVIPVRLREAIRAVGPTVHPDHSRPPLPTTR